MSLKRDQSSTYYEILEIEPTASSRDIRKAYMRAKETYSPESPALYTMFTPEEARELLKMIDEAYATLGNQHKRDEYDRALGRTSQSDAQRKAEARPQRIVGEEGAMVTGSRPLIVPKDGIPDGFARTRFGVYEVDPILEKEVSQIEECDGSFIQKIRQYKKVNLEQLSESTRISKTFLGALETNSFEALPAAVFVRGFVLQVARTLGVPDRLADAYMKRFRKNQE